MYSIIIYLIHEKKININFQKINFPNIKMISYESDNECYYT